MKQGKQQPTVQRLPAEKIFSEELECLLAGDSGPKPPGWLLSPLAVEHFILGNNQLKVSRKFIAERELVRRVIIGIATNRGAMFIGEPGTAKSWLSELLAAAISGGSTLVVQGGAISDLQQILYRWDQNKVNESGWSLKSLIPGALMIAMQQGKLLRFEEMARCSQQIQDALLSLLSDRSLIIPELSDTDSVVYARQGFNIVATSNSLDEGVNTMSAALKRRLSFETLHPILHIEDEIEIVMQEATTLLSQSGVEVVLPQELIQALVTIFHELRTGCTLSGSTTDRLVSTVMSTAEAVSVAHALGVKAYYYRSGEINFEDLVHFLIGAAVKDNQGDLRRLKHYFESNVSSKTGEVWHQIYKSADTILK